MAYLIDKGGVIPENRGVMLTKSIIRVSAFLGIIFGTSMLARADVLIDTFAGPGNGVGASGQTAPGQYIFRPFTVTGTYSLDSISAALFLIGGTAPTAQLNVILYSDNGGVPGTALETIQQTIDRTVSIYTVNSVSHPTLTTGKYHVAIGGSAPQWAWMSPGDQHKADWGTGSPTGGWDLNNLNSLDVTLRVNASSVVPEPASLIALGLGTAVLIRRRKK